MVISCAEAFISHFSVNFFFHTIAMVQRIINRVAGNLIAVQASPLTFTFAARLALCRYTDEQDTYLSMYCSPSTTHIEKKT